MRSDASSLGTFATTGCALLVAVALTTGCTEGEPVAPTGDLPGEEVLDNAAGQSAAAASAGSPRMETATVSWHPQAVGAGFGEGEVEGSRARLRATDSGASVTFQTRNLEPGHAYTLWFVIVENPEVCDGGECTAEELLTDEDVDRQITYGAGHVAGNSGRGTFSAHLSTGPVEGWFDDFVFEDPRGAEYHFVLNDHGPRISEQMPGMIQTYRGGCSDDSPFPPIFPETALADGEPGPNMCLLYQSVIFTRP